MSSHPGDAPQATLESVIRDGAARLAGAGVASARVDAETLAAHVLGRSRGEVVAAALRGTAFADGEHREFEALLVRREVREPLQHLTGRAAFRRLELAVGPGVFVPRPETEVLAGLAIDEANAVLARSTTPTPAPTTPTPAPAPTTPTPASTVASTVADHDETSLARRHAAPNCLAQRAAAPVTVVDAPVTVVDLCAGSGAVALAVADEAPHAQVIAVELDPAAHAWAQRNVRALPCGIRVDLRLGDAVGADHGVLADLVGQVDVLVANPPYIPDGARPVDPEVADHDPQLALFGGGRDGLDVPRAVVLAALELLRPPAGGRPGGLLLMEHADVQGAATRALVADDHWQDVRTVTDLAGRDRVLVARRAM